MKWRNIGRLAAARLAAARLAAARLAAALSFGGIVFAAGTPASISIGGPNPTAVGTPFSGGINVVVLDASNNPLSGISVTFSAPSAGASGTFSNGKNSITVTTVNGSANVPLTANSTAGSYPVTASTLAGFTVVSATVTLTNIGPPAILNPNFATGSATIGASFGALEVTVTDGGGSPLNGIAVTFSAPSTGASGTFPNASNTITVRSDPHGVADAGIFTANSVAGTYNVAASALSGTTVISTSFTLTNRGPASITPAAGVTPQTAYIGTNFSPFTVTVRDSQGIPLYGLTVTFSAPTSGPGGGFLTNPGVTSASFSTITDLSGMGSSVLFQANNIVGGPYSVKVTCGNISVNLSLTNQGPAVSMTPVPGSTPQTARVGATFANSLSVKLLDAANNPAAFAPVVFSAPNSGPSGTFANGQTSITPPVDVNGNYGSSFKANNISGSYTVVATTGNLKATFSLTNEAIPSSITPSAASSPQSAPVNTAFVSPLAAIVKDQNNAGVPGVVVTFTAPSSGPSCVFSNSSTMIQVTTDASGTATAPVIANSVVGGPYSVQATTPAFTGGLLSTTFALTNTGGAPAITQNPSDVIVAPGATATFTAAATGSPTPTVQWQQSTDGGSSFSNISLATSATLSFPAQISQNGYKYRAAFSNSISTATSTAATLTVQSGPAIRSATPVIPSFMGNAGFSSNMYLEIYGANFTNNNTRTWASADFGGLLAPTSLDGVSVKVNNKPAFVYFISPNQININVPDDDTTGLVTVQVFTANGPSNTVTVQRSSISPTLQTTPQFNVGGKQYVVALTPDFKSYIGQPNLIPGVSFVLPKPGDTISIYALGAGPTNPATQAGVVASVNSPLALPFQLKIGGVQAVTTFAGLLANTIGLYQLNAVVPQVSGDQPIEFIVNGVSNNQNLVISVGP